MKVRLMASAMMVLVMLGSVSHAATNDLNAALQRGLFEEEANHNLNAAIQAYQSVINQYDKDRKFAATAVFRLGESYRKQGKTNEATAQYERIVREFADQSELLTASRSTLAMLGYVSKAGSTASGSETARQEQKRLYDEEIKLAEKQLAEKRKQVDLRNAQPGDLIPIERDLLRLRRQLAALDAGQPSETTLEIPSQTTTGTEAEEIKRIQAMIKDSPDLINAKGPGGTPLHQAVAKGQLIVAQFLLANGASVNAKGGSSSRTPLHEAAAGGHKTVVELLLNKGADIHATDQYGNTPLHIAADQGFKGVVEVLLAHGAQVNAHARGIGTPLHSAIASRAISVAELLLEHGADVNAAAGGARTPLHDAAARGDEAMVELLITNKANVNAPNDAGETPLHLATEMGQVEVTKSLLLHDCQVDPKSLRATKHGWTPLHYALDANSKEVVKLLLQYKADPNAKFDVAPQQGWAIVNGCTPLLFAIYRQNDGMVEELLRLKADPNLGTQNGQPPIFAALNSQGARLRILDSLLEHHADLNARLSGVTLLMQAVLQGDVQSVQAVLAHNPEVNAQTERDSRSALHYAALQAAQGHEMTEIGKLLIQAGADVNLQNASGETALTMLKAAARSEVCDKLAELLRAHGAMEDMPRPNQIQVRRASAKFSAVLAKSTNDWNRFTILEVLAMEYRLLAKLPQGEGQEIFDQIAWRNAVLLAYPDFEKVRIKRPRVDLKSWQEQTVDLTTVVGSGDCSKDVHVMWGDVIEVPEADHPINEPWPGFTTNQWLNIEKCLSRTVEVIVKGRGTKVRLTPEIQISTLPVIGGIGMSRTTITTRVAFWIKPALRRSDLLLASSDLARVKVTRQDTKTGKKLEWILDCSDSAPAPDFWLRDGDVIEVPDKS